MYGVNEESLFRDPIPNRRKLNMRVKKELK